MVEISIKLLIVQIEGIFSHFTASLHKDRYFFVLDDYDHSSNEVWLKVLFYWQPVNYPCAQLHRILACGPIRPALFH